MLEIESHNLIFTYLLLSRKSPINIFMANKHKVTTTTYSLGKGCEDVLRYDNIFLINISVLA